MIYRKFLVLTRVILLWMGEVYNIIYQKFKNRRYFFPFRSTPRKHW